MTPPAPARPAKPVSLTPEEYNLLRRMRKLAQAAAPARLVIEIDETGLRRWWVAGKAEG